MVKDKAEGLLLHDEEFKKLFEYIRNKEKDKYYIDIAIEISKNAKYPYGAIVVKDDEIIGRSDDKTLMETSILVEVQSIIEHNNAGIRKIPGTVLKNSKTGEIVYTLPETEKEVREYLKNLE